MHLLRQLKCPLLSQHYILLIIGIVGGYSSFQYTAVSAENWLQLEPICFHDNLLPLLLSGDVELNPGPRDALGKQPANSLEFNYNYSALLVTSYCTFLQQVMY